MFARRIIFIACIAIFLVSCSSPELRVQDEDIANTYMEIKQPARQVRSVAFSSDGKYVLTSRINNNFATLWDVFTGTEVRKLSIADGGVAFSPDGRYAATSGKELKLWDMSTGNETMTIAPVDDSKLLSISFSSDWKYVMAQVWTGSFSTTKLIIYEVKTRKMIEDFNGSAFPPGVLSPDGRYALSALSGASAKMTLWDVSTGDAIRTVTAHDDFAGIGRVFSIAFSPDGKYALSSGTDNAVRLWNIPSLTEVKAFRRRSLGAGIGVTAIAFSPDGKYALSGGPDGYIRIWDILTGAEVKSIKANKDGINSLSLSQDGRYVVSGGDAFTRIFDISTGKKKVAMISFDDGEWLVITPEGYYNSSKKGAQYLSVKVGDASYGVDNFHDVFYRPDIVAATLKGDAIKDLITVRMSDAIKNPPPAVEILSTPEETDQSKVEICYQVKSAGGGIGEVRVFHNGKLIVSIKGNTQTGPVTVKAKGEAFKDCKEIETVSGENEVSVTAFNADNTIQGSMQTRKFKKTHLK